MQSMKSLESMRGGLWALLVATFFLMAGQASATPANFASGGWGFDPAGLGGLPETSIDGEEPFLAAGDPRVFSNLDVGLIGSAEGEICFLASGANVCQVNANSMTGAYSALVTLQVSVLNPAALDGPFTLLLTGLGGSYDPSQVSIELNPTAPAGLDTSAVMGFVFDGTFSDDFVHIEDLTNEGMGDVYDYIGWTVVDGGSVTFRYDVSVAPNGQGSPALFANAIPTVVPEPGTALLMGLGLAGLASAGRRSSFRAGRNN
jgi:hypothetical protein